MSRYFFIAFILVSFITQTISEPGTNPILSRLTFADIFGAFALLFGLTNVIKGLLSSVNISRIFQFSILMILGFFIPIMFSLRVESTLVECLILLFLVIMSVGLYQEFKDDLITVVLPVLIYTLILASLLGFYDLFSKALGLPRIFPERTEGEALSGFRNAGQAGAYYLVMLSILIPFRFSKLATYLSPFKRKLLNFAILLSVIFIFMTGKIAAYIGFSIGIFLFLIYKRNLKAILSVSLAVLFLSIIWSNLDVIMPTTYKRVSSKYNSRVTENIEGTSTNTFFEDNFGGAIAAFEDRPLIGSGLGAFAYSYSSHEVHSTYLKMLGETGLIGTMGYILFIISFLFLFRIRREKNSNPYADFIATMYPFVLGCFISWSYTYHLRKREFWIMLSILIIANYAAKKFKLQDNNTLDEIPETV